MSDRDHGEFDASAQIRALLAVGQDAIFTKDLNGTILSWGKGAERLYGYEAHEIVGQSVALLFPENQSGEWREILTLIASGGEVEQRETVRVTKAGACVDVMLTVMPIRTDTGVVTGAVVVARDITEAKQTARNLDDLRIGAERGSLVLQTASRVALDILASRSGLGALRHIAEAARSLAGARYAALGIVKADGNGLQEFITVGLSEREEQAIGARPVGAGVLGLLLKRAEPLRLARLGEHPASVGFPPNHPPMESFLGVPIRRGATILGSLYLSDKIGAAEFTEEDEVFVQSLSAYAAVTIYNLQMLFRQRALVRGLINAQEEERRAIAYDLHDGLTQYVMAAHMYLEAARIANDTGKSEKSSRDMAKGLEYLHSAVLESRRLVNGLRTLALDDLGLAVAVEQMINEEKVHAGWSEVEFVHNIAERRFTKPLETAVYRVIQESLTNVRKHADASKVRVLMLTDSESSDDELLTIEVRDWGCGFEPDEKSGDYRHVGLEGMSERASLLGSRLAVKSSPGNGTVVSAVFRVNASTEEDQ